MCNEIYKDSQQTYCSNPLCCSLLLDPWCVPASSIWPDSNQHCLQFFRTLGTLLLDATNWRRARVLEESQVTNSPSGMQCTSFPFTLQLNLIKKTYTSLLCRLKHQATFGDSQADGLLRFIRRSNLIILCAQFIDMLGIKQPVSKLFQNSEVDFFPHYIPHCIIFPILYSRIILVPRKRLSLYSCTRRPDYNDYNSQTLYHITLWSTDLAQFTNIDTKYLEQFIANLEKRLDPYRIPGSHFEAFQILDPTALTSLPMESRIQRVCLPNSLSSQTRTCYFWSGISSDSIRLATFAMESRIQRVCLPNSLSSQTRTCYFWSGISSDSIRLATFAKCHFPIVLHTS